MKDDVAFSYEARFERGVGLSETDGTLGPLYLNGFVHEAKSSKTDKMVVTERGWAQ